MSDDDTLHERARAIEAHAKKAVAILLIIAVLLAVIVGLLLELVSP
jgi:hypothetical protein